MEDIYKSCAARFIATKGLDKYNTLYTKIAESNEFVKFCGIIVQKGLPPTARDFIVSVATIWYVFRKFDQATNIMAALIELKLWNEKVNSKYNLVSEYQLVIIATRIYEQWSSR